jgi:ABC-2 type transport system ATP-binding protein
MDVIEVRDLVKSYDGSRVVDGLSLTVEDGEIYGIVGPNGAGKTTTVESIVGLRTPDSGQIAVLGLDPMADHYQIAEQVGMQLQESRFQDKIRVGEAIEMYASLYRAPRDRREVLGLMGLTDTVDKRYKDLSGGQKQRLSVAVALIGGPRIAILDELTTGLDPQARRDTWEIVEAIRDDGVTVVLVTHFMEEAERLCDRIMVIDRGRAVALDTPAGLVERVGGHQTLRFRPSESIADIGLDQLAEVDTVAVHGGTVVVNGHGNVVHAVTALLAQRRIIAHELRIDQVTLEDAYLEITAPPTNSTVPTERKAS